MSPGLISGHAWLTSSTSNLNTLHELKAPVLCRLMLLCASEMYHRSLCNSHPTEHVKWKTENFTVVLFNKTYANVLSIYITCFKVRAADTQTINAGHIIMLTTCYVMFCFLLNRTLTDSKISQRLSSITSSFSGVVYIIMSQKKKRDGTLEVNTLHSV